MSKNLSRFGPIFIMVAASLWAFDALFRTQLTYTIPSSSIIFFEHLIGFLILSPILFRNFHEVKKMNRSEWINVILMTIVSSTLGAILFTQALNKSFASNDFITPILLQKLQPIFVIGLSAIILREKITLKFLMLAAMALIGSYMISFGTDIVPFSLEGKMLVFWLAVGAAACWGSGTILSKKALGHLSFPTATALRFALAVPVALIFMFSLGQTYNFAQLTMSELWRFFVIAGITGGAGAIYLYYWGLKHTQAKVSTFAELMLPVVSIIIATTQLNPYGAPQTLSLGNIFGIVILIVSIIMITLDQKDKKAYLVD